MLKKNLHIGYILVKNLNFLLYYNTIFFYYIIIHKLYIYGFIIFPF